MGSCLLRGCVAVHIRRHRRAVFPNSPLTSGVAGKRYRTSKIEKVIAPTGLSRVGNTSNQQMPSCSVMRGGGGYAPPTPTPSFYLTAFTIHDFRELEASYWTQTSKSRSDDEDVLDVLKLKRLLVCLQVLFEHEGVFIHPSSDEEAVEDLLISGSLRIVDKVVFL